MITVGHQLASRLKGRCGHIVHRCDGVAIRIVPAEINYRLRSATNRQTSCYKFALCDMHCNIAPLSLPPSVATQTLATKNGFFI